MKHLLAFGIVCGLVLGSAVAGLAKEKKIKWSDVPAAVKTTIEERVKDGKITEVVKKEIRGKVFYEFEVQKDGKEMDYSVAADGKFLGIEGPGDEEYMGEESEEGKGDWIDTFQVRESDFVAHGRNRYFILEPGHQLYLKGKDDGEDADLTLTVLTETRKVGGIETRIVEERETKNGQIIEVSRNFFALDRKTNDVYYFGEEVDMYEDGKVSGHGGAWLAGIDGARYGLLMPGAPKVGYKHYQEIAPEVAMDRAEIVSVSETFKTPAGTFKDCLKVAETSPLEPGHPEHKFYAPGIGLIRDGGLKLVRHGPVKEEEK
ncbi:hypothetical protein HY522_03110 [bacterium]|nr:hypothetical protein [bacterium]